MRTLSTILVASSIPIASLFSCATSSLPSAPKSAQVASTTSATPTTSSSAPPSASLASPTTSASAWSDAASMDPCQGDHFDLEKLPAGCAAKGATPEDVSSAFGVRIVPSASEVRAGKSLDVSLEMTNTSSSTVDVVFKPSCASFEVGAWQNGKRADYVNDACGFGGGCGGTNVRLSVKPKGTIVRRLALSTIVRKVRKTSCDEVEAGPLKPGGYELRVEAGPFFPIASAVEKARATIVVTK